MKHNETDLAAAATGGAGSYGAYIGSGDAIARANDKVNLPKYNAHRKQNDKKVKAVKHQLGIPPNKKVMEYTTEEKNQFFRNYPKDVPGGQIKRVQSRIWGAQKYGRLKPVAITVGAGAATSAAFSHRKHISKMSPDPSAMHVPGSMGRLRKVKRGRLRKV